MHQAAQTKNSYNPANVDFFDIQVSQLADGNIAVAITATWSPYDTELCTQHLIADRAKTIDEALGVIKREVRFG